MAIASVGATRATLIQLTVNDVGYIVGALPSVPLHHA
jgi:hypothetical protein